MATVTSVRVKKTGVGKKGPWSMYEATLSDGTKASGFDEVTEGDTVSVEQNGQYLNYKKTGNGGASPRGGSGYGAQRQSAAPPPATNGNGGKEGYWERKEKRDLESQPRIERQHSQEMALRYIDIKQMDKVDTKTVQLLTDWFQRDIGRASAVAATEPKTGVRNDPEPREDPLDEHPMNPINQQSDGPDDDEPPF